MASLTAHNNRARRLRRTPEGHTTDWSLLEHQTRTWWLIAHAPDALNARLQSLSTDKGGQAKQYAAVVVFRLHFYSAFITNLTDGQCGLQPFLIASSNNRDRNYVSQPLTVSCSLGFLSLSPFVGVVVLFPTHTNSSYRSSFIKMSESFSFCLGSRNIIYVKFNGAYLLVCKLNFVSSAFPSLLFIRPLFASIFRHSGGIA